MKKAAEALAAAQARVIDPEAENAALVAESREVYGRLEGVSAKLLESARYGPSCTPRPLTKHKPAMSRSSALQGLTRPARPR